MTDLPSSITDLRQKIDAIDDQLIGLLKERIGIVAKVGAAKREHGVQGCYIRPGREAAMHARILKAFAGDDFSAEAALGIWRLIISASTHHESPLKIAVAQGDEAAELCHLARDYFGAYAPKTASAPAMHLMSDLLAQKLNIAILPFPRDQVQWWLALAQSQAERTQTPIQIFAQLPVIQSNQRQSPQALAVGLVEAEATDAQNPSLDVSYLCITLPDDVSSSKLQMVLAKLNLNATLLSMAAHPPMRSFLVSLDGFVTADSAPVKHLQDTLADARIIPLGAHAKSIALS